MRQPDECNLDNHPLLELFSYVANSTHDKIGVFRLIPRIAHPA
ncbi:hypothetical protein BURPS1106A_A0154 [Burkholderia pseudomallei 1106a]|uniref:Uncharacterized protein n=1 Tax=Burkholderia pseudomallei (strain 1106a) TaxID=357348 RepID=A3P1I7_BURP0|nr:hypothetical protein BURPS1106A_A0154 [Burkholderia pseudomallei 1106a]